MPINRIPVDTSANSAASHAWQCNFLRVGIWAQAHRTAAEKELSWTQRLQILGN